MTNQDLFAPVLTIPCWDLPAVVSERRAQGDVAIRLRVVSRTRYEVEFCPSCWLSDPDAGLRPREVIL